MSWPYFGELRSAIAAPDWARVAELMDDLGGCDDEAARYYAHEAILRLPIEQRPLRIAIGAKNVDRRPLPHADSLDLVKASNRVHNYGPNFVIAPAYGYTPKRLAAGKKGDWSGWNSYPAKLSAPLTFARLDAIREIMRKPPQGVDTLTLRLVHNKILDAKSYGIADADIANLVAAAAYHARIKYRTVERPWQGATIEERRLCVDGEVYDGRKMGDLLHCIIRDDIGEDAHWMMRIRPNYEVSDAEALRVLFSRGRLAYHICIAAGGYIMPSPYPDGEPYVARVDTLPPIPGADGPQQTLFQEVMT